MHSSLRQAHQPFLCILDLVCLTSSTKSYLTSDQAGSEGENCILSLCFLVPTGTGHAMMGFMSLLTPNSQSDSEPYINALSTPIWHIVNHALCFLVVVH